MRSGSWGTSVAPSHTPLVSNVLFFPPRLPRCAFEQHEIVLRVERMSRGRCGRRPWRTQVCWVDFWLLTGGGMYVMPDEGGIQLSNPFFLPRQSFVSPCLSSQ